MPAGAPSRPISATTAPARCRARPSRGAAVGRSQQPRLKYGDSPRSPGTVPAGDRVPSDPPSNIGGLGLNLITGPANAGKVALLLRRYLDALPAEPYLIVPNAVGRGGCRARAAKLQPALLAGSIGTFDDLFTRIAKGGEQTRPVATEAQRTLVVRRALAGQSLNGLGRSARFGGFADALLAVVGELESGLLDPTDLDGELAPLYAAYRAELDRLGLWDRDLIRRRAAERVASELDAWQRRARLRLRVRGPHGRRVGAAAGTGGPERGDGLDPVRARPRRLRVAAPHDGRPEPHSRTGASRSCRRATTRSPSRRSHTSSAHSSARRSPTRHRSTAPCASSKAPAHAGRSSSSARSCSR